MSQSKRHDEFLELCAASLTGDLTDDEQKRLDEHLAVCQACRVTQREYQTIIDHVLPTVAAGEASASSDMNVMARPAHHPSSLKDLERRVMDRVDKELSPTESRFDPHNAASFRIHRTLPSSESTWSNLWTLFAAGILLFAALGVYAYRIGFRRSPSVVSTTHPEPKQEYSAQARSSLEEQLSDAGHERAVARAEIARRDKTIAELRRQLAHESSEISEMKTAQAQLEEKLRTGDASRQDLARQQAELAQKLDSEENNARLLQEKFDSLAQQSAQETAIANASEAKAKGLTRQLQEQQAELTRHDQLLAHDRDIREVMGARDLYIAEIYDVASSGETQKPYGRVFYTRGKSLIFYAYDLDQQAEVKPAATFQAWGRRGPDRHQAINLGVFFEDNVAKNRWILKCDDPKTLAEIDAVFVTIEPNGGSDIPSNKMLLFASLKVDPNHP